VKGSVRRHALVVAAAAAMTVSPALGQVPAARQISVDPFTNESGQHETAVEPDSFAFGDTVVAAFQLGRIPTAGASGMGWGTSLDGGVTWSAGVLPSLTVHGESGARYTRATDPAVAYDSAHGVWLISVLALRDGPGGTTDELLSSLLVSRSADGTSWSPPVVTSPEQDHFAHDKNWIVCDNGTGSRFRGRCYVAWTSVVANLQVLAVASSSDGGLSWSTPTVVTSIGGSGWQPLVRPDGTLVIVFNTSRAVEATRSTDGGRSFSSPVVVASLRDSPTPGLRAPSLPSAELDATGRITVAWADCRFRSDCGTQVTPNDIVIASSTDGRRWTRVRRVPTGLKLAGLPHLIVGLGVDPSTRGARTRIGVTFYALTPLGCTDGCSLAPFFVSSSDNGEGWTASEQLAQEQPLESFPTAGTLRFVGDYISTSFVSDGVAVPVFAAAVRPFDGRYHQGIFATAIPARSSSPVLRAGTVRVAPRRPRVGTRVAISLAVRGLTAGLRVGCRVELGRHRMRLVSRTATEARATCIWSLRPGKSGQRISGTITLTTPEVDVRRPFVLRTAASRP
jgi:hypothetical protein